MSTVFLRRLLLAAVLPREAPLTFVVPGGFDPGWSPLGRGLRRWTGDRLRAEALLLCALVGGGLLWLMAAYAADVLAGALALRPLVLWGALAGGAGLFVLAGGVGVRPPTQVTYGAEAVCVKRGRERLRLPFAAMAAPKIISGRTYHRHYRRYEAVRPFLNAPLGRTGGPVLLLRARNGRVAALGLGEEDRVALAGHVEEQLLPEGKRASPAAVGAVEKAAP